MANPLVGEWDPKELVINYGGSIIDGFADGTMVNIAAHDPDYWKKVTGADGEMGRFKSADNSHEITITLLQLSESNEELFNQFQTDVQSGHNMKPLTITDNNGTVMGYWPEAWIRGEPEFPLGKENQDRQWTIDTGQRSQSKHGSVKRGAA